MPDYRLYLIGGSGHVEGVREINAVDDAAAIIASTTGQGADRMELWCGPRMVEDWSLTEPNQRGSWMERQSAHDRDAASRL